MDAVVGIANKIREVKIVGIPIGEAVLGGGSALVLAELTDALVAPRLPTVNVAFIKAGETYAMHRWGHKAFGAGGARVATLFLGYDTVRTLIPLESWIKDVIAKITGAVVPETQTAATAPAPVVVAANPGGNGQADPMTLLRTSVLSQGGGS